MPEKREILLQQFFEKYTKESTNLYLIGNRFIIEHFYTMNDIFCEFTRKRNSNDWNKFWIKFEDFSEIIEDEYWKTFEITYSDYIWNQYNMTKNIFFRGWNSLVRFLFDFSKVVVVVTGFILYLALYDKIYRLVTDKSIFPSDSLYFSLILFSLSIMFFGVMGIVNAYQIGYIQRKQNIVVKFLRKRFPRVVDKWDGMWDKIFSFFPSNKEKINVPPMYEKKDIDT